MKIVTISSTVVLGRPGGMRGGAGGRFEGGLEICRYDLQLRTCAFDLTRQLLPYGKGGGFKRSAHSAGPGRGKRGEGRGKREEVSGKR